MAEAAVRRARSVWPGFVVLLLFTGGVALTVRQRVRVRHDLWRPSGSPRARARRARQLIAYAKQLGITMFSTPFDFQSADFLAALDLPAYKSASGDLTNIPLIKHVAAFGKPILLSTGGATMDDVRRAYDAVRPLNRQIGILQCTAGYPPAWAELNLRVIETFREEFPEAVVGLSSHDSGIAMALVGYVLGARIVEKHFTLNRAMKGTDHAFSLEHSGLEKLVRDLTRARAAMGDGSRSTAPSPGRGSIRSAWGAAARASPPRPSSPTARSTSRARRATSSCCAPARGSSSWRRTPSAR